MATPTPQRLIILATPSLLNPQIIEMTRKTRIWMKSSNTCETLNLSWKVHFEHAQKDSLESETCTTRDSRKGGFVEPLMGTSFFQLLLDHNECQKHSLSKSGNNGP